MAEKSPNGILSVRILILSNKLEAIKLYFDPEGMTVQDNLAAVWGARDFIEDMIQDAHEIEDGVYKLEQVTKTTG